MAVAQLIVNIAISASQYCIVAIGFALLFLNVRFFQFSYAGLITVAAYSAFCVSTSGHNTHLTLLAPILSTIVLGLFLYATVFRPLRRRQATSLALLLASLGVYICIQNTISLLFGSSTRTVTSQVISQGMPLWGARVTLVQVLTMLVSLTLSMLATLFIKRTRTGLFMRALASDAHLADTCGIDLQRLMFWAYTISAFVAAIGGILLALDLNVTPTMGLNIFMSAVLLVVAAGSQNIPGIAAGAFLVAVAQHLAAWFLGSEWQETVVFLMLVAFLFVRPSGFHKTIYKSIRA